MVKLCNINLVQGSAKEMNIFCFTKHYNILALNVFTYIKIQKLPWVLSQVKQVDIYRNVKNNSSPM